MKNSLQCSVPYRVLEAMKPGIFVIGLVASLAAKDRYRIPTMQPFLRNVLVYTLDAPIRSSFQSLSV